MKFIKKAPRVKLHTKLFNKYYIIHRKLLKTIIFSRRAAIKGGISKDLNCSISFDRDSFKDEIVTTYTVTIKSPKGQSGWE